MFSNPEFKDLYDQFTRMFEEEGDVFGTLMDSITNDYKHSVIPSNMHKTILIRILSMAAVEYFKNKISIIEEKEIIDEFKF